VAVGTDISVAVRVDPILAGTTPTGRRTYGRQHLAYDYAQPRDPDHQLNRGPLTRAGSGSRLDGHVRAPRSDGADDLPALRCHDLVLRGPRRRRARRIGVLQGAAPGAADHCRAADRHCRFPADGAGIRRRRTRDHREGAHAARVQGAPRELSDVEIVAGSGRRSEASKKVARPKDSRSSSAPAHPTFATRSLLAMASIPATPSPMGACLTRHRLSSTGSTAREQALGHRYAVDYTRSTLKGIDSPVCIAGQACPPRPPYATGA